MWEFFFQILWPLQVNLCLKLLFLNQLTQNMTSDCPFFMKIVSSEYLQDMLCTQIVVFVLFWHSKKFWHTTTSEKDLPVRLEFLNISKEISKIAWPHCIACNMKIRLLLSRFCRHQIRKQFCNFLISSWQTKFCLNYTSSYH